ncbi:MAG TPA: hypothetical protein VJ300_04560 [Thermoplasmata archaeon]|nr:hypothetical protein [Thermoplasmata archaeon]
MQWPRARALAIAGGLLLSGAGLHLVAAYEPEHLEKGLFFGFFWAATIVQGTLAVLLLRITRLASAVGFGVNAFLVILWTATRLVPLPGEAAPEPVDVLGVATKVVEIASLPVLLSLVRILPGVPRPGPPRTRPSVRVPPKPF